MRSIRRPRLTDAELVRQANGYRFPARVPTAKQTEALHLLIEGHVRGFGITRFADVPVFILSRVYHQGETATRKVLEAQRSADEERALSELAIATLRAMHEGRIGGVRNTKRSDAAAWLFRKTYEASVEGFIDPPDGPSLREMKAAFALEYVPWERKQRPRKER